MFGLFHKPLSNEMSKDFLPGNVTGRYTVGNALSVTPWKDSGRLWLEPLDSHYQLCGQARHTKTYIFLGIFDTGL